MGYMKNQAPLQERTCSLGIHGEGEPTGQAVNPGSPGKMVVKTASACVYACVHGVFFFITGSCF